MELALAIPFARVRIAVIALMNCTDLYRARWTEISVYVMSFNVIKVGDVKAVKILGGPIKPVVNAETVGSKNMVFALGVFDPGEGLVPHIHPESEEVYYVTKGSGTVYVGEEKKEMPIEADVALYIPPGTIHGVRNTGDKRLEIAFFVAPGKEPSKQV